MTAPGLQTRPGPAHDSTGAAAELSVLVPVFNERDNLPPLLDEIADALQGESFEVVVVNDGSTDGTADLLPSLVKQFGKLAFANRPTRAGQSAALMEAAEMASGQVAITLDGDGQNDPKDIPQMLAEFRRRNRCAIVGYRHNRVASAWKKTQTRIANRLRDLITGDRVRDTGCALRVLARTDLLLLPRFRGLHRFIPTLLRREGIEVVKMPVNDRPRLHGKSKYGMWNRVFVGLVDALGVRWLRLRSFSQRT